MPKSGSHLLMNLMNNFEIKKDDKIEFNAIYKKSDKLPVNIDDGKFAICHLIHSNEFEQQLKNFKKILLIRNLKEIKESNQRRVLESKNPMFHLVYTPKLLEIKKWEDVQDVFVLSFDDLINKNLEKIDLLQLHLFGKLCFNSDRAISDALKQDSDTKSSIRK